MLALHIINQFGLITHYKKCFHFCLNEIYFWNKWFYAECDWSLLYFSSYQQRRVSCHPGDLSRKCHLCHGSCKSQKWGTRPPSSHYKTVRNIFPSLRSRELYFTLGSGGCALTFPGIMFLCIGVSQRYMPKYPIMGWWLFCVPANRAHPKQDSANINNFRNM